MPFIIKGKSNYIYLIIVFIVAALTVCGILIYIENYNNEMYLLNQSVGMKPVEKNRGQTVILDQNTTDWKTYRNDEYGFVIKYPPDFTEQKIESETILLYIKKEYLYFGIDVNKKDDINRISSIKDAKKVNIGGHSGYEYFAVEGLAGGGTDAAEVLLVQVGQDSLGIGLDYINYINDKNFSTAEDKKDYIQNLFNQIFSTFKFISTSTASPITVLSPNGGEKIKVGETYNINWNSNNVKTIIIALIEGNSKSYLINNSVVASFEKYNWVVNGTADYVGSNNLKIALYDAAYCNYIGQDTGVECIKDGLKHSDDSDNYFSITSSTSTDETAGSCPSMELNGYSHKAIPDIKFDLNGDNKEEILRLFQESNSPSCEQSKPIIVKIFSGSGYCLKEVFNYDAQNEGNMVTERGETFSNFWGDGSNAVLVKDESYGCGCGEGVSFLFFTYKQGNYSVVKGPQISGQSITYKFDGTDGIGKKIIVAKDHFAEDGSDYCCGCTNKKQFVIYNWDGEKYIEIIAGMTKNKYTSESVDEILAKEPDALNQ